MTGLLRLLGWLGSGAAIFAATFVLAQPRVQTIAVNQLRPGMKGYGLTVFRGTQPERFEVEVIDVLHNFRPDQDLILVKTKHPSLQHAKIVAGMSGSPIYFNGKLAGAYAYAWSFGRDPVAGVTPIKNMMAELRRPVVSHAPAIRPLPQKPRPSAPRASLPPFPYLGQEPREALFALKSIGVRRTTVHDSRVPGLQQATTPLMVGGLHEATLPWLSEQLEPLGLVPLQAGGGSKTSAGNPQDTSSRFVDGGAIAVELATGDISMSGTGTVTYVDGRRVLAFGHPMLDAGEVGLPTATARVLHIFASYMRSFKIAESVRSLGALVHDRQSAIVIDTQTKAETIPVKIMIDGLPKGLRKEWNVQIANHRMLTPLLVMVAAMNALKATVNDVTDIMYTVKSRVNVEGHGIQEVEDLGYTDAGLGGLGFLGGIRLFSLVEAAYANPYEAARISAIELRVSLEFNRNVTQIVRAAVSSDEVNPGASLPVYVTLQTYGQPERTKVITVDIPERAAGRKVELVLEPGNAVEMEYPIPRNLDDLLQIVRNRFAANMLIASVKMPTHGLRMHGHVAHDLPGSAIDVLQPANVSSRPIQFMTQIRRAIDFDTVLAGSARLKLEVREVAKK
jgi:hypothetical protein